MKNYFKFAVVIFAALLIGSVRAAAGAELTAYVNPFLGTAPLTNPADIGFTPPWRVWAGLVFPGASLPNAMVQLTPVTKFGSGAGYEYENTVIQSFAHTCKGHWNLCNIPILPATGEVDPDDFGSTFTHGNESAHPGYYQVFLERCGINAELTVTPRCGYHKYTFKSGVGKKLIVDLAVSNERIKDWQIEPVGRNAFQGFQTAGEKVFFYAVASQSIKDIGTLKGRGKSISVVSFSDSADRVLEIKLGLSFVSVENAKLNLEKELAGKNFDQVRERASRTWEDLLGKVQVKGGTERQKDLFYSCLYRSFLWPALRSDVNGEFRDEIGQVVTKNFQYYTVPSLWDTYRNKLVLLEMMSPQVAGDVIQSLIDRGEHSGFMPTFFHGDHAAAFVAGASLRGLTNFDLPEAYHQLLKNATVEGGTRPYITEYMNKGYISTPDIADPHVETKAKAAVTKTLEYAYDDYAVALLAKRLNDVTNYSMLMQRSHNFTNLFDSSIGLMRGRLEDGSWVKNFNPEFPYYEYMYREANAWESSFFAPQDTAGLMALYSSKAAFEQQLDLLFSIPWNTNYIAQNVNCFIGQYCHGNQPDHGFPYLYYFLGKPEKSQHILDTIMDRFYGMGADGLALCGMDDCGEMSAWYVFNAMGIYPYSPADENYIVTVPLFDKVKMHLNGNVFTIIKKGAGRKLTGVSFDHHPLDGYFVAHHDLVKGKTLVIETE